MSFEPTISMRSVVIVQHSIYGNDNTLLINALTELRTQYGRGVVEFDANTISFKTLQLQAQVKQYARIIKPLNWALDMYIGMDDFPKLEPVVADLCVTLSITHFGAPNLPSPENRTLLFDPYFLFGFQSLVNILKVESTYLKFLGAYRFDKDLDYCGVEGVPRELLNFAEDRLIFTSDWPHNRFEGLDSRLFVEKVVDWTEETSRRRRSSVGMLMYFGIFLLLDRKYLNKHINYTCIIAGAQTDVE
ncbi:hypothetical protein J3E71DRAFT_344903 [Bipolaris maydis]|nr:hypothetical protein J3E71DRAFT_344903 [Bipolaris maydis]